MRFTLETFIRAQEDKKLLEWTIDFLLTEGNNKHLAEHLQNTTVVWADLLTYPLKHLRREMGHTEEGLIFSEPKEIWNNRINLFTNSIKKGDLFPPLIATDFWDDIHLADGSHRHEALVQSGIEMYWTMFFLKDEKNICRIVENSGKKI